MKRFKTMMEYTQYTFMESDRLSPLGSDPDHKTFFKIVHGKFYLLERISYHGDFGLCVYWLCAEVDLPEFVVASSDFIRSGKLQFVDFNSDMTEFLNLLK